MHSQAKKYSNTSFSTILFKLLNHPIHYSSTVVFLPNERDLQRVEACWTLRFPAPLIHLVFELPSGQPLFWF